MTDATRHLLAALLYVEHDLAVFPCQARGKKPRTMNGFKDATTDPEIVRSWWAEHPDANIGLPAELNNLLVLDIDPRAGGDVTLAALGVTDWPQTPTADTGGGGVHLVFRLPDYAVNGKLGKGYDGYDIKTNGYIIAPPSVHPNGQSYRWRDGLRFDQVEPADVPTWLEEKIRKCERRPVQIDQAPVSADPTGRLIDRSVALDALRRISTDRADGYDSWLKVGMALHAADEGLLPAWDEWSRTSSKWQEGICETKWRTFRAGQGITPGTLVELARQDGDPDFLRPGWRAGHPAEQAHHARQEAPGGARGAREGDEADAQRLPDVGHCPPGRHGQDDIGNAERFAALCGNQFRYCWNWGTWLFYDGTRWARDTTGITMSAARAVARSILREAYDAPDHQRDSLTKHARATARRGQLEAMLSLARTDLAVESKDLDADPLLLNCTNGTVDLQTGALRPHRSADMLTRCTTCAYWPDAHLVDSPGAGEWRKFIKAITNGNDELAAYLQRAAGYSVTGDPCEEALFFAYGPERTGKSTFLATVGYHLADYADQVDFTAFLRKRDDNELRPELDKLQGKRFAASSETNAGRTMAEGLVKAITGNEPISTAAKYKDPVTWTPAFTLWLAANDRPVVRHNDGALWRRLKVVPFLHQVAPEAVDTGLKARLRQTAGEAVLAWLVAGCLTWRQEGLGTCAAVEEAIAGYREEMDPLGGWLADRCDVRLGRDDWFTPTEDLYQSFRRWCEESGEPLKLTQRQFGDHLSARHLTHARKRYNGEPRRGYVAIRLTEQPQFGFDDEDLPSEEASIRHAVPDAHHLPAHPENTLTEPVREASAGGGVPGVQGGCTNSAGAKSHVRLSDKSGTCRHSGTPGAEVDPFASEDPLPPLTPDEGARW